MIIKMFAIIWCDWLRYIWSAIRYKGEQSKVSVDTKAVIGGQSLADLEHRVGDMYKVFEYRYDGVRELLDAMRSPMLSYSRYLSKEFIDDCDGFHAAVKYWVERVLGVEVLLYTMVTSNIKDSHTVCVFKLGGIIYCVDYDVIHIIGSGASFMSVDGLVYELNRVVMGEHNVIYGTFTEWGCSKGRYVYDNGDRLIGE